VALVVAQLTGHRDSVAAVLLEQTAETEPMAWAVVVAQATPQQPERLAQAATAATASSF
jgi:hypothetical protein